MVQDRATKSKVEPRRSKKRKRMPRGMTMEQNGAKRGEHCRKMRQSGP